MLNEVNHHKVHGLNPNNTLLTMYDEYLFGKTAA